jgi:hypothetical protein
MKKLILAFCLLLLAAGFAQGESITLNSAENLAVPTSQKITDWKITEIDNASKNLTVRFRWVDSNQNSIQVNNRRDGYVFWNCRDIETDETNAECLGAGDPYECCTGAGAGTCDDLADSCFSDVFNFTIRQQDVGTSLGIGLRTLIWNEMKADILTGVNDGSFD